MHTYHRPQVDQLVFQIMQNDKPLIVAVTGPRQTGKTTMIEQALERIDLPSQYLAVDEIMAADESLRDPRGQRVWLLNAWRRARENAEEGERGFVLALDEIQHIEDWSLIVKGQWDRDRRAGCPLRVIVAGSAPWSMWTGLRDLAGRFMPVKVSHWSFTEMADAFGYTLDQYLFFGGYPGAASLVDDVDLWRAHMSDTIVSPSIEKDVIALTRIEKPALMRRLVELAGDYSGQILSYNKMLGQIQEPGNTATLADYLDLLSEAGLLTGLSKYSGAAYAARGSSPKLNVLNTALMTMPLTGSFDEIRADGTLWGRIVESAVGAHLHNTAGRKARLYHWREGPHEVDFVLSRGPNLKGIEVKSGTGVGKRRGRVAFRERFPEARTLLVGARGMPLEDFLSQPAVYWADYDGPFARDETRTETAETEDDEMSNEENGRETVRESTPKYAGAARPDPWRQPIVPGWKESEDYGKEAERKRFMSDGREQIAALARGEGSPWLWERIGEAYMCAIPGHFGDEPADCLRVRVESDGQLLEAALRGLPHFVRRGDLPPLAEIVQLDQEIWGGPLLLSGARQPGRDRQGRRRPLERAGRGGDPPGRGILVPGEPRARAALVPSCGRRTPRPLRRRAGHRVPAPHPRRERTHSTPLRSRRRRRQRRGGAAGGAHPARRLPDTVCEAAVPGAPRAALGRAALPAPGAVGETDPPPVGRPRHGRGAAGALARGRALHVREAIPPRGGDLPPDRA